MLLCQCRWSELKRCIHCKSHLKILAPNTTPFSLEGPLFAFIIDIIVSRQIIQCFHDRQQHQHPKPPTKHAAGCGRSISPYMDFWWLLLVSIFIGPVTSHQMPSAKVASVRTHETNSQPKNNIGLRLAVVPVMHWFTAHWPLKRNTYMKCGLTLFYHVWDSFCELAPLQHVALDWLDSRRLVVKMQKHLAGKGVKTTWWHLVVSCVDCSNNEWISKLQPTSQRCGCPFAWPAIDLCA